jgi:hypothetical protein
LLGPQSYAPEFKATRSSHAACSAGQTQKQEEEKCALQEPRAGVDLRMLVRSWSSCVRRKHDRLSVLHYCETLYNLNLTRRALYSFLSVACSASTADFACQASLPPHHHPPAAVHAPSSPRFTSAHTLSTAFIFCAQSCHMPCGQVRQLDSAGSPSARAKAAIQTTIRCTQGGAADTFRRGARGDAAAAVRGESWEVPAGRRPEIATTGQDKLEQKRPGRMRRMPPLPLFRATVRAVEGIPSEEGGREGGKDNPLSQKWCGAAGGAKGLKSADEDRNGDNFAEKCRILERKMRRDIHRRAMREKRETLLSKVEVIEARLLQEISVLDAQVCIMVYTICH